MPQPTIRSATPADAQTLFELIKEFAAHDGRLDRVTTTAEKIRQSIEASHPPITYLLAEINQTPAGFASYFPTHITSQSAIGLCIEDIYVRPTHRRTGLGTALMNQIKQSAHERGITRIEWTVGTHNHTAIEFYKRQGATIREQSRLCRLILAI